MRIQSPRQSYTSTAVDAAIVYRCKDESECVFHGINLEFSMDERLVLLLQFRVLRILMSHVHSNKTRKIKSNTDLCVWRKAPSLTQDPASGVVCKPLCETVGLGVKFVVATSVGPEHLVTAGCLEDVEETFGRGERGDLVGGPVRHPDGAGELVGQAADLAAVREGRQVAGPLQQAFEALEGARVVAQRVVDPVLLDLGRPRQKGRVEGPFELLVGHHRGRHLPRHHRHGTGLLQGVELDVRGLQQAARDGRTVVVRVGLGGGEQVAEQLVAAHAVAHEEKGLLLGDRFLFFFSEDCGDVEDEIVNVGQDERGRTRETVVARLVNRSSPASLVEAIDCNVERGRAQGREEIVVRWLGVANTCQLWLFGGGEG